MPAIWKRGEHQYCVRVRRKGINKSKTFETHEQARKWGTMLEAKIDGNQYQELSLAQETTLRSALEWYQETVIPRTPKSEATKRSVAQYWLNHELAEYSLTGLSTKDLAEWRSKLLDEAAAPKKRKPECSAQTVVHRLNLISHLYNTIEHEWDMEGLRNPVTRGLKPRLKNARKRRLPRNSDEEIKILKACDEVEGHPWLGTCVRLALETGIRRDELFKLEWSDVDLRDPHPSIFLAETKSSKPRTIPIWKTSVELLKTYNEKSDRDDVKLFSAGCVDTITRQFAKAVKRAGSDDLTFHDLRHEATSRLFEETNMRDLEIMAVTGHQSSEMLKRYAHLRTKKFSQFERRINRVTD